MKKDEEEVTVDGKGCSGTYLSHIIVSLAHEGAFIFRQDARDLKTLIIE